MTRLIEIIPYKQSLGIIDYCMSRAINHNGGLILVQMYVIYLHML